MLKSIDPSLNAFFLFSPASLNQIDTADNQIFPDIPRDDCAISLQYSSLELNVDVVYERDDVLYAAVGVVKIFILGPIAPFTELQKLQKTTASGKFSKSFDHPQVETLIYLLIKISFGQNGLSMVFERDNNKRQVKLSKRSVFFSLNVRRNIQRRI